MKFCPYISTSFQFSITRDGHSPNIPPFSSGQAIHCQNAMLNGPVRTFTKLSLSSGESSFQISSIDSMSIVLLKVLGVAPIQYCYLSIWLPKCPAVQARMPIIVIASTNVTTLTLAVDIGSLSNPTVISAVTCQPHANHSPVLCLLIQFSCCFKF